MKYPLSTFAPDVNPLTPGVVVECDGVYPSETGGLRATPTLSEVTPALESKVLSSLSFQDMSTGYRHLAAVQGKIYELSGLSWEDVSNATTSYGTVSKWRWAVFGNLAIAVDQNTKTQVQATSLDKFIDLTGSPPNAKFITTAKGFVIVAYISTTNPQRVQWCAEGDATDWTPSLTTGAAYTDIIDSPGPITALNKLGDGFVVFKERSLYIAYYAGAPFFWNIQHIPAFSGTICPDAIVEMDGALYYPGVDDFYMFDGTFPRRIGEGIRKWFWATADMRNITTMRAAFDLDRRLIFWWFPTQASGDGSLQKCLIFDVARHRWGKMTLEIEEILGLWQEGITYADIPDYFAKYSDITNSGLTYDSPFWSATQVNVGAYTTNHKLAILNAAPTGATIVTGDIGDQVKYSRLKQAWPYFTVEPTSCTAKGRAKVNLSDGVIEGSANSLKADGGIDMDITGKFLSLDMTLTGDFDIVGFDADITPVSVRGGQ